MNIDQHLFDDQIQHYDQAKRGWKYHCKGNFLLNRSSVQVHAEGTSNDAREGDTAGEQTDEHRDNKHLVLDRVQIEIELNIYRTAKCFEAITITIALIHNNYDYLFLCILETLLHILQGGELGIELNKKHF